MGFLNEIHLGNQSTFVVDSVMRRIHSSLPDQDSLRVAAKQVSFMFFFNFYHPDVCAHCRIEWHIPPNSGFLKRSVSSRQWAKMSDYERYATVFSRFLPSTILVSCQRRLQCLRCPYLKIWWYTTESFTSTDITAGFEMEKSKPVLGLRCLW